jgi:hypothetical protein
MKRRVHLGGPGVDRKTILKLILKTGYEDVNWSHLVQDSDQMWFDVNTVINLRVPQKDGNYLDQISDHWLLKEESALWS